MFIRPWLEALKSRWMPGKRRTPKQLHQKPLQSHVENLEERIVLSAFDLVTVIPNQGVFLSSGAKMYEAPQEMTLRFSPGQTIDPTSLGAITVTRAGLDGIFDDPATPALESNDDVGLTLGYVGLGDNSNEVIVRYGTTLVDDKYQIRIQTSGATAIVGNPGDALIPDAGKPYRSFNFELDLGALVESVVPQPVIRSLPFSVTNTASISDGDLITINAGPYAYTFEMDLSTSPGVSGTHIAIGYAAADTPAQVATTIAAQIGNALNTGGNLSVVATGEQVEVSGTAFEPTVAFTTTKFDAFAKTTLSIPAPASLVDGNLIKLTLNGTVYTFEFNNIAVNNLITGGNIRIDYTTGATANTISGKVAAAINALPINTPTVKVIATVVPGTTNIAVTNLPALGTAALSTTNATVFSQNFGTLTQATDTVVVYFNQDQLDATIAQNPTYYRLINSATNAILLPQSVKYQYNPLNGLSAAVLKFPADLTTATYNLKVGTSSEPNDTALNAVDAGTLYQDKDYDIDAFLGDSGDGLATSGASDNTADVDLYRFFLDGPGLITLTATSQAGLTGVVTLLDSLGNVLAGPAASIVGFSGTQTSVQAYYAQVSSTAGTGGYHLTIQSSVAISNADNNSSFTNATDLGELGSSGQDISSAITFQPVLMPPLPGGDDEPGHRNLPSGAYVGVSSSEVGHGIGGGEDPSAPGPISFSTYSFPVTYGPDGLLNQISPEQKQMARDIFEIFSEYAGIQFQEVTSGGLGIVTGDIRQVDPTLPFDAAGGIAGRGLLVMNYFSVGSDNTYGGNWMNIAFHEIGHGLGLGHSYDVPSVQGGGTTVGPLEQYFTGENDFIHLLRIDRNDSSDIDMYRFDLSQSGIFSAETIAERLAPTSQLNTLLTLYQEDAQGRRTVIARNDDFYSNDSGMQLSLAAGRYYIGVSSTGNNNYDPSISDSGNGGTTDGAYDLKLSFKADTALTGIRDATGQAIDGDHDGKSGGEYNSWFEVATTKFVDKLATTPGNGNLATPFQTISAALAAAAPGEIVRIVGNGGADRDASTLADNVPYAIGKDYNVAQSTLADGVKFQVPANVTVMIDAGSMIKLHGVTIDVGTASLGNNRAHGALEVLGTPVNNVYLTSWRDDAKGSIDDAVNGAAATADWGGIVFRSDSDVDPTAAATKGVFLNNVTHATVQFGGGSVSVDGALPAIYSPIQLETARPTLAFNTIKNNADAAISANPDSFKADDGRIGPDIHGNLITQNSTNGLFIRIQTLLGGSTEQLNVLARFDDTDITHVITQNLIINGTAGGSLDDVARPSGRLMIDPGTIVKLSGARIETGIGNANLIAEGTAANPIRLTSQQDDRYGAGGTFDLKNDGVTTGTVGSWGGIFVQPTSSASFDHVSISYAGGLSEVSGGRTDNFNAIEVLQGHLRVTNSLFEGNAGGQAGNPNTNQRDGRGSNDNSTIFVRGAQPIIVDNTFRDNVGNVISINANSLKAVLVPDQGRATGAAQIFTQFDDNYGPMVRLNTFANSTSFPEGVSTLGMNVRAEELVVQSIWDDTDVAHVLTGTIFSSEFHTEGGLRLQSNPTGSLIVKLSGAAAGFAATGDPLEIDDRIGGTVQIIGQPGFPVILTSLKDDTVSAGFKPNGFPQFDTNGDNNDPTLPASTGSAGDWNSISLDRFSNDRNVAIITETEPGLNLGNDINSTINNPQSLGTLAPNENSGNENQRLGFEVHGFISTDSPSDMDVYSFTANGQTEVWIDIDKTSDRLDSMIELLDSSGNVLARSLNSQDEATDPTKLSGTLAGTYDASNPQAPIDSQLNPLVKYVSEGGDFYTSNFHDAGFRVVLPGTAASTNTYFVRVRSQPAANPTVIPVPGDPDYETLTGGAYQLQVRLQQTDEIPGSTVRYADIRYSTNGIELHGLPAHSILTGEAAEGSGDNNSTGGSQLLGPLLQTDRNTLSVAGTLATATDIDFFRFTVDYSQVQVVIPGTKYFPTMFDIDWADGLTRPDTVLAVFDANLNLIYVGRDSDIADDQPAPSQGQDLDDLTRSSLGKLDAFIGSVNLTAGVSGATETGGAPINQPNGLTTYYVAVVSNGMTPTALTAQFNNAASPEIQRVRLEPINSIQRIVEDHIGFTGYHSQTVDVPPVSGPMFNLTNAVSIQANIRPFTLSDVNLFVTTSGSLNIVDPFNGTNEVSYSQYGQPFVQDLDMRSDGTLWGVRPNGGDGRQGTLFQIDTSSTSGADAQSFSDNIADIDGDPNTQRFQSNNSASTAMAFRRNGVGSYDIVFYATPDNDDYISDPLLTGVSKLYRGSAGNGSAAWAAGNLGATGIVTDGTLITTQTMGMQISPLNGNLYGVSNGNQLYVISQQGAIGNDGGTNVGNPDGSNPPVSTNATPKLVNAGSIVNYSALLNAGEHFAGIADAPQNVENQAYANYLFIITTSGRVLCVDPTIANAANSMKVVFDSNGDNVADSKFLATGIGGATGLAFSPVDYNLWHPTALEPGVSIGHGIATAPDNSRAPSTEAVGTTIGSEPFTTTEGSGGGSLYFGVENYSPGSNNGNYFQYQSNGQLGVLSSISQQDLTANANIRNNYNVPGGAYGSLVGNSFSLEGYAGTDKPTLYFNYWLQTQDASGKTAGSMSDSARVYISRDSGQSWELLATNDSTLSTVKPVYIDAELPGYLSTSRNASSNPNQQRQELFDTGTWRQARVDLNDYVGEDNLTLRFDFSTSGNAGSVIRNAVLVPSDDRSDPTYVANIGDSHGAQSNTQSRNGVQSNAFGGFYVDDIIVGFAGRGEMVTNPAGAAAFTDLTANPFTANPNGVVTDDPDPNRVRQLLFGDYQLEIRRGTDYAALDNTKLPLGPIIVGANLSINDRLTDGYTIRLGNNITDGDTVSLSDGLMTKTFEFDSDGVLNDNSHVEVDISTLGLIAPNTSLIGAYATALSNAIVSANGFGINRKLLVSPVSAKYNDTLALFGLPPFVETVNSNGQPINSDRIDVFGATSVTALSVGGIVINSSAPFDDPSSQGFVGKVGNDYPFDNLLGTQVASLVPGLSTAPVDGHYLVSGIIGDGPHADSDADFYKITLAAGQTIKIDLDVTNPIFGDDSILVLTDSSGNPVKTSFNDPGPGEAIGTFESYIQYTAPAAGVYFLGVAGDDYDLLTSPLVSPTPSFTIPDPASLFTTGNSEFNYDLHIDLGNNLPIPVSVDSYVQENGNGTFGRQGDSNLARQQGQIIIENNTILSALNQGILLDANVRSGAGNPVPGAALNTSITNDNALVPANPSLVQGLVTGIYVQNNVVARSGIGIDITGNSNLALGPAAVPFYKVVNNTIFGGDTERPGANTFGIRVQHNASPTLLNNAIVNTGTSIFVDATSTKLEIEANLFQGNRSDPNIGNNNLVDYAVSSASLFVGAVKDNYYPAPGSPLVDSSRSIYDDRGDYTKVTGPLGITPSPIQAPLLDRFGQKRVDDGNQAGPPNQPGLGQSPFQDRGALERADFEGGIIIPTGPQDNDGAGIDLDPSPTTIWIDAATLAAPFSIVTSFTLQLIDTGIGIDDSTVDLTGADFIILKNGQRLNDPATGIIDYIFTYNQNTNEAIFTSVSTFELDARYLIVVDPTGIQDLAGNDLQNNQSQALTPANANVPAPFDSSLLYFTYIITDGDNDAPVNRFADAPGGVQSGVALPASPTAGPTTTINEDSSITFSYTNGNAITVFDQDAFLSSDGDPLTGDLGGRIRVTVSIPNGSGTLALDAGSTADLLDPTHGGTLVSTGSPIYQYVLEGRIDDINTALAGKLNNPLAKGITFTPLADFPIGPASSTVNVTIVAEDLGKFGPPAPGNTVLQTSTSIVPVVILPVNDVPTLTVATASPITILEDKVAATTVSLSGIAAGGGEAYQNLMVEITGNTNSALIPTPSVISYTSPNSTGSFDFVPAANRSGTATLTIRVTDSGFDGVFGLNAGINDDKFVEKTITINVTEVNDEPTIAQPPTPITVLEDEPNLANRTVTLTGLSLGGLETFPTQSYLSITATSSDQTLIPDSSIIITPPVGNASTGTLVFTPALNRNGGPVTITITVTDSGGTNTLIGDDNSVTTSFVVNITPVNDEPKVTMPANRIINEDDPTNPQLFTLTGISPGDFEPGQTITGITITSSDQTVIPNANIVQDPAGVVGGNLGLTITPLPDQFGLVTITVTMTDSGSGIAPDDNTVTKTFTINVLSVNDLPQFNIVSPPSPLTIAEDSGEYTINLDGFSPGPANESGQVLVLSAESLDPTIILPPIVSTANPTSGGVATVKFTPVLNANTNNSLNNGPVTIRITLSDGINVTTKDILVNITPVNDEPTLNLINSPAAILEGVMTQQTVNLSGISPGLPANESSQLPTISAVITGGTNMNLVTGFLPGPIVNGNATLKYTPVADEFGTAVVTVTIDDHGPTGGANDSIKTQTFTITITGVNDQPTLALIGPQVSNEDAGQQPVPLTGLSVGGIGERPPQELQFVVTTDTPTLIDPGSLSVVYTPGSTTGQLLYTARPNQFGLGHITIRLNDGGGTANGGVDTYSQTFNVTISQVQDTPTDIQLAGNTVFENKPVGTVVGSLSTTDVDLPDDTFTYSIVGGNGAAFFQTSGSQLQTSQVLDYETVAGGFYSVTVRSTDRFGLFVDKSFNITVQDLNDAPTLDAPGPVNFNEDPANPVVINLTGISAGAGENQAIQITATAVVTSGDPDLFTSSIPVIYTSPNGTGTLTLSPKLNKNGTATITVTVHDLGGTTVNGGVDTITRTFQVTVNPVNDKPSDILLSNDTIAEVPASTPLPLNVLVGNLSSTDPDNPAAGDTFSYSLVLGFGSDDNTKFKIVGNQLIAVGPIDFDQHPNYSVRVRSTDSGSPTEFFEKILTVHTTNINEPAASIGTAPNAVTLIANSIAENQGTNAVVGDLVATDPDAGDVNTFALVSGQGADDNSLFKIVNGQLISKSDLNYEVRNSYTVRIRATDLLGLTFESAVPIAVVNVNENPTNINLSNSTIVENSTAPVGNFTTVDPDLSDSTFTYELVGGDGSADNARFAIVNNELRVVVPPDYEDRPSHFYSIRVKSTDPNGLSFQKIFTITVTNVNEAPTAVTLSNQTIAENKAVGSVVGTLGTDDQDSPEFFTYTLVGGAGSADNLLFEIAGDQLVTKQKFDFETRTNYTVRVRSTDHNGLQVEQAFAITVTDAKDGPVVRLTQTPGTTTGSKSVLVDGSAQVTDIDSDNFDGGKLVVTIQSGEQTGDTLAIQKGASFNGQKLKAVHRRTVLRLGKQDIGTISGGVDGIPMTIQFGGGISLELFQKVMQSITFKGKPFAAPRVISMQAFDETGLPSDVLDPLSRRSIVVT